MLGAASLVTDNRDDLPHVWSGRQLQRLERDGLVASDDGSEEGPQKDFRITAAGREELEAWLPTPPDTSTPPRDELVIKVLVALRLPGIDVVELVQAHRRHLVETMRYYTRLKEDAGEQAIGLLTFTDDHGQH